MSRNSCRWIWNDKPLKFSETSGGLTGFKPEEKEMIGNVLKRISQHSGLRRWNTTFILLVTSLLILIGYSTAFVLITNKQIECGVFFLILTPTIGLLAIAYWIVRKPKKELVNRWMEMNLKEMQANLRTLGIVMNYFFLEGNLVLRQKQCKTRKHFVVRAPRLSQDSLSLSLDTR